MAIREISMGLGIMTAALLVVGSLTAVISTLEGTGLANAYPKGGEGYRHHWGMLKPGEYASGTISSIQNDENGNPSWVVSGDWKASMSDGKYMSEPNATNSAKFNAVFDMAMTNGSAQHQHKIYNFTLTNVSIPDNNTMVFDGTVTITMRDGPVNDVPITITVMQGNVISISLEPSMINNHFGDTPIYGVVKKAISVMK
ncbi:MAG TPA: hypothetical protein VE130_14395 [Nitrososphaeraceae archaeon]|nr:hypothetical protein [Nitrososphaeraceae archaeon]